MSIQLNGILNLALDGNPRFINGDGNGSVIWLSHQTHKPASPSDIERLRKMLNGTGGELVDMYSQTNGMRLFSNVGDSDECFYFLPVEDMESNKNELDEWIGAEAEADDSDCEYGEDYEEDDLTIYGIPPWWDTIVVIAGWGYAPERLFIATEGEHVGAVFQFEHDGGYIVRVAKNVVELFSIITNTPVEFITKYYGVAYFEIEKYESDCAL